MTVDASTRLDIDKRMAQVVGEGLRVTPVDIEDLTEEARQLAMRIRAAFGIPEDGAMPVSIRTMLIHPELFQAQMTMGIALASGTIPARERELAVLRNAWLCGAAYEWGEHVNIGKAQCGLSDEEIERCTQGWQAPGWTEHESAILKGVEEFHADHALSEATWNVLAKSWDQKQLMEFPVLVGAYLMTALQQNTIRMPLDPGNPGLGHR